MKAILKPVATTTLDMSQTNVLTSGYTTLLAKSSNLFACVALEVFNPSGSPMLIAVGDAGSEVPLPYTVLPGGTEGAILVQISQNTRISLKAYDRNVSAGRFVLNQLG